jgi:hypothetical protein
MRQHHRRARLGDHGGLKPGAARRMAVAAGQQPAALGQRVLDTGRHLPGHRLVDQRPLFDTGGKAVARLHLADARGHALQRLGALGGGG